LSLRVALAGTPGFALPALAALHAYHEVVGVLTQPDRPRGRGQRLSASAVKSAALNYHLPVAQPETLKAPEAQAQLSAWQLDALIVVAYGQILPPEVLKIPRLGCLNIHASLLPRWRGAAPIQRAILAGDAESGVSIMQMDAGLDTGPVLLQRRHLLASAETGGTLHDALATLGAAALIEALDGLSTGALRAAAQPAQGVTYADKIRKSEGRLDFSRDALSLERVVRAFNPWPIAETVLDGEQLRILSAHATHANSSENVGKISIPGSIVAISDDSVVVQCGTGCLSVTELQRPGRRAVAARDFSHSTSLLGRRLG
jgi:methionyl-tRNA formyltransferase